MRKIAFTQVIFLIKAGRHIEPSGIAGITATEYRQERS